MSFTPGASHPAPSRRRGRLRACGSLDTLEPRAGAHHAPRVLTEAAGTPAWTPAGAPGGRACGEQGEYLLRAPHCRKLDPLPRCMRVPPTPPVGALSWSGCLATGAAGAP